MRRGQVRVSFAGVDLPAAPERGIRAMKFTVTSTNGADHLIDMTHLPVSSMTQAVVEAIQRQVSTRRLERAQIIELQRYSSRFMAILGDRVATMTTWDLTVADIDRYLADCHERCRDQGWYDEARKLLCCLKTLGASVYSFETWQRLQIIDPRNKVEWKLREAYPTGVAKAIRRACKNDMLATVKRLMEEGPILLARGRDVRGGLVSEWAHEANAVWLANELGPVSYEDWCAAIGVAPRNYAFHGRNLKHLRVSAMSLLYPTSEDLLPFFILFLLATGIPPSNALSLRADCLEKPANGRFALGYVKHRARGKEINAYFKDGNLSTPGGIIRAVLKLTSGLRHHVPSDRLWWAVAPLLYGQRGNSPARVPHFSAAPTIVGEGKGDGGTLSKLLHRFCERHDLRETDGKRLRLQVSRFRKNYKVEQTRLTGALVESLTSDHTLDVHLGHYARLKAAVPIHRQIAYEVMKDARPVAVRAVVLTGAEEADACANPTILANRTGRSAKVVDHAMNTGEVDMWMAKCLGFTDSPFAPKGVPCPAAALGSCLDCSNGVITPSMLPAIFAFLNHLVKQHRLMQPSAWAAVHGETYKKLVFGVLSHYSDDVLREAKLLAESRDGELLYLGPEVRPLGHL